MQAAYEPAEKGGGTGGPNVGSGSMVRRRPAAAGSRSHLSDGGTGTKHSVGVLLAQRAEQFTKVVERQCGHAAQNSRCTVQARLGEVRQLHCAGVDATDKRDDSVVKAVETLLSCCVATQKSAGQKKATPPLVVLHWGTISSFPAFVTSVSAKFTLFNSDGTPIRAACSVSLEEMPGEQFRQNPTSGSHEVRRVHRTIAGDTLASVAYAEYGDPNAWRPLAAFNEIDDPLRVPTGTMLLLPSPEELAVAP